MSSTYNKNKKELAGVRLVAAKNVWVYNKKTKKKDKLNPDLDFVGKVDMVMPNVILKANQKDKKTNFIEDVSSLPQRTKSELVEHFFDENGKRNTREVAYLVRTDKNAKTKKKGELQNGKERKKLV